MVRFLVSVFLAGGAGRGPRRHVVVFGSVSSQSRVLFSWALVVPAICKMCVSRLIVVFCVMTRCKSYQTFPNKKKNMFVKRIQVV